MSTPRVASLLGSSPAMRALRDVVARVGKTLATVLITGESGTGKELVARAIHERSPHANGPFVPIHCAAIPAELLESELFGHERGSFTDAHACRRGLFSEARGGTVFLDEIGEMPLTMQVKLLRALQERRFRPVGGNQEQAFDARVIAATHRDLEREVRERRFREDLFYRIHVCPVETPRLRDRDGDITMLARAFVDRYSKQQDKRIDGIEDEALAKLREYPWPGNVRELENAIERAVAMALDPMIGVSDLPPRVREHRAARIDSVIPTHLHDLVTVEELERRYTLHVLELVHGNKAHAARILGYDRRTLYRKLGRAEPLEGECSGTFQVPPDDVHDD